jgi:hypothetical protein
MRQDRSKRFLGCATMGAILAAMVFASGNLLHAQDTNLVTFTAVAEMQGGTNDNGANSTILAPVRQAMNTKQILEFLAQDENAAGRYASPNFPAGAKLMVGSVSGDLQVWDRNNKFLVDVTNILKVSRGTNVVMNGKINDSTGLNNHTVTREYILKFNYDDTAVLGSLGFQFYLQGLTKKTDTQGTPDKNGVYTETVLNEMSVANGDGNSNGLPFVISGSVIISGKTTNTFSGTAP